MTSTITQQAAEPGGTRTTVPRIALALLVGSLVGAGAIFLSMVFDRWDAVVSGENAPTYLSDAPHMLGAFALTWCLFAVGLVLIGGPIWAVLHKSGHTNWIVALCAGACVGLLGPYAMGLVVRLMFSLPLNEPWAQWSSALEFAIIGAMTALGIQTIAYRTR